MVKAWTSSLYSSSSANSILFLMTMDFYWIFLFSTLYASVYRSFFSLKIESGESFVFYVDDVKKQLDDLNSDATYPLYTWGDCSRAFLSNLDGMCVCVCVYPASTFYKFPRTSFKSHCPPPPPIPSNAIAPNYCTSSTHFPYFSIKFLFVFFYNYKAVS